MLIAISATFTAEAIQPGLAFWLRELSLAADVRFAAYQQVFQQLLDPSGLFATNNAGINVILIRPDDWSPTQPAEFLAAVRAANASVPLIVVLCPGATTVPSDIQNSLAALPSVYLLTSAEIAALYPVSGIHDPHGNELGHVPYTPLYFLVLATAIVRKIHAIIAPPFKAIALDCDDTLWAGICGEDGPEGVVLDPPRRSLQAFMSDRRRDGMLLTLCSKNNPEDVAATFRAHPEFPLAPADFVAQRVNWDDKATNLAGLADELDIGLDTFILIDDNPKEVQEAQAGAPAALSLALPRASEIPDFLAHVWAFDRARVTDEDRRRGELYAQRAERTRASRASSNLTDFIASLALEVAIAPLQAAQTDRVAQLTQRTNQMNVTCIRRSAAEIRRLAADRPDRAAAECLTVHVTDRFGSYGLTGAIIFNVESGRLTVDTFLLSCRALGRGVEHRMLARLGEIALERGLASVEIPFVSGQRNRPALLFLESLGARHSDGVFHLSAAEAAAIHYHPATSAPAEPTASRDREGAVATPPPRIPYARIAAELRTPDQIFAAMRIASRRRAPSAPSMRRAPLSNATWSPYGPNSSMSKP